MSFLFWLELTVLGVSTLVSTSLILVVLGVAPRRKANQAFALFVLMQTIWSTSSGLLCLSLWSEQALPVGLFRPYAGMWLEIAALAVGLMGTFALNFTASYLDCHTRPTRLAVVAGLAVNGIFAIPLFQHHLLNGPRLDHNGILVERISPWGWLGGAVAFAYVVWSLVLFWRERHRKSQASFAWGMFALLIGMLAGAGLKLPFPFTMATINLAGFSLFGYGIIHKQILNPLQEHIVERTRAEAEAARRTQSLLAINKLAIQCTTVPPETDLFRLVSEELRAITGSMAVSFTTFDPRRQQLVIRYIATHGTLLNKANELLGRSMIGLTMPVGPEMHARMLNQVINVEQDLTASTFGVISPSIAQVIQTALDIDSLTAIVLKEQEQLLGTLVVIASVGAPPIDLDVAQTFASVAAAALQRARAEEARRISEEWYRTIFEYAADGLIRINASGIITDVNRRTTEILGPQVHSYIGEPVTVFGHLVSRQSLREAIAHFEIEQNQFAPYEMLVNRVDGVPLYIEINARPIMNNDRIDGAIVVVRDISERKQAEDILRLRNRELQVLNQAGQAFNSSLELDDVLITVLEQVRETLNVTGCSAWLIDHPSGELVCRQCAGLKNDVVRGWRLSPSQGIAGWTATHNQSLIIPDTGADTRYFSGVDVETGMGMRSLLSVPLQVKDTVIGVLEIVDVEVNRFTQADLPLAEALASTAATAIENARLYEQARHDARVRETLLQEANHRVRNNLAAILGILKLEMDRPPAPDLDYHSTVQDLTARIRGLSSVHNMLSKTQWSPLPLEKLAYEIVSSALNGSPIRQRIQFNLSSNNGSPVAPAEEPLLIGPRQATGLAIILNELTTNSIKHAFQEKTSGQIDVQVCIEADRWINVTFRDDGPGWPEDVLQGERQNVGLHLIRMMVRSPLQGQLDLDNDHGAVATIRFRQTPP